LSKGDKQECKETRKREGIRFTEKKVPKIMGWGVAVYITQASSQKKEEEIKRGIIANSETEYNKADLHPRSKLNRSAVANRIP